MPILIHVLLGCLFGLALSTAPVSAQQTGDGLLKKKWRNCVAFNRAVAKQTFSPEPDLFLCHKYEFKGLYLYGYVRFQSDTTYQMTLKTNKHGMCSGPGEMGIDKSAGRKHASASGRFECADGSQGGLAFELDWIKERGVPALVGSIFGGIDGHESRFNEEDRVSADFWIYDRNAVRLSMGLE
ncbi:MAG: hypothetical protein GY947_01220 [Rhodobacteraceae bacterium]|nr:hypothetical protein [Paracoccaceae bacterium]